MEVEMGFASCKMAEKWFSIEDLIKCERGSWIFTPCVQEHLFPQQALCLFFLHFGGFQWGPTVFSKHYAVITGRWNWAGVVFTCFGLTWWDLRLPNVHLGVTARLAAWQPPGLFVGYQSLSSLHRNAESSGLGKDLEIHISEEFHDGFEGSWVSVNKLANWTQKTNSIGLFENFFWVTTGMEPKVSCTQDEHPTTELQLMCCWGNFDRGLYNL